MKGKEKMKKISVITGASSGMGRDFVKMIDMIEECDEIWVIARRREKLEELKSENGKIIHPGELDLSKNESIAIYGKMLEEEKPQVVALVNAAGFGKFGKFEDIPLEEQMNMIDLNCKALMAVTYLTLPYMPEGSRLTTPKNREATATLMGLERAMHTGEILEGMAILCDSSLQLHIDLPQIPHAVAVIPRDEVVYSLDGEPVKDIAILTRVGKAVCFKVMGIDLRDGAPYITLSRRAAQADCAINHLSTLCPGDIIPARVTHTESFGAFVDIGCGIPSLLSVDTISVSRISHPTDRLKNGQFIWTVVRTVIEGEHGIPKRIFVSTKELLGTWEENAAQYHPGQTVVGIVRSVETYGAFVEMAPNLTGLAELKDAPSGGGSQRSVISAMIGEPVAVFIKSIQPDRMKVKLVLIDGYIDHAMPSHSKEETSAVTAPPLAYFIDGNTCQHLSRWVYSPACATKRVESVFEG